MKFICTIWFVVIVFCVAGQSKNYYAVIGTYTSGKSEGIYMYRVNNLSGKTDSVTMIRTSNPSYLVISKNRYLYAVNENSNSGTVTSFDIGADKKSIRQINQQLSGGDHPCHISIDKTGKWVAVSNYSSGSFSILPIRDDGGLGPATEIIQHTGSSINKERQNSPHAHCAVFSYDGNYLLVADLGIDKIMIYPFDKLKGKITKEGIRIVRSTPGSGPRQIVFNKSGTKVYVVEELAGTISVYNFSDGKMDLLQNISTLPAGFSDFAGSADIHISSDQQFLYTTNRGESNTIAVFKIEPSGKLILSGHQSTLGKGPRFFSLVPRTEKFLAVANQNNDEIVIFRRNAKTGMLKSTKNRIHVGKPVCIAWGYKEL